MTKNEAFGSIGDKCVGRQTWIVVELILYSRERLVRMVGDRSAAFLHAHRQSSFDIESDAVNPLDGIVSVLVGALSLSLCNSFCQSFEEPVSDLSRFVWGLGAIRFHRLLFEYTSKYCTKEPSS